MTNLLYGCHDRDAHPEIPGGGWCVDAVLVTDTPPNYAQIRSDINWIVRLNNGWNPQGTIPLPSGYDEFAKRCADFVAGSKGAQWFIIGNEPNHRQEWPNGVKIEPQQYADCYNRCYATIKSRTPNAKVLVAAVAPWDISSGIDWLAYYQRMLGSIQACDGLAIHAYTHGDDPELPFSVEERNGWLWHLPVFAQTLSHVPSQFRSLPVHITETNQGDNAWVNAKSGWVVNAYDAINQHNRTSGMQKVQSLSLYRWRGDKWQIYDKPHVLEDFQAAVARGYESPSVGPGPTPEPPDPDPQPPTPTPNLEWDKRLDVRGCKLYQAATAQGETVWRVTVGRWFDPNQAQGRVNVYVAVLDENEQLLTGVPVKWFWDDGGPGESDTKPSEIKSDPWLQSQGLGNQYSLDFTMYNLAPSYGVQIVDGSPSDSVWGCGLGSIEDPYMKIHTSYYFRFQRVKTSSPPTPPQPSGIEVGRVTASAGLNVRSGPGTQYDRLGALQLGSTVLYDDEQSGWLHVIDGWVSAEYVGPATAEPVPPAPGPGPTPAPQPTGDNRLDPLAAEAVYRVESGGKGFGDNGKLIIRFEAHLFDRNLGDDATFAKYFTYDQQTPWQGQMYRVSEGAAWLPIHSGHQADEWNALGIARGLNDTAGLLSISMGAPQILGSNYKRILYSDVQAMFSAFGRSLSVQDIGFFNFCLADPNLAAAINAHDWAEVALRYNGPGNVTNYAKLMADAYAALVKMS